MGTADCHGRRHIAGARTAAAIAVHPRSAVPPARTRAPAHSLMSRLRGDRVSMVEQPRTAWNPGRRRPRS
jgi:hypothetical protein